MLLTQTSKYTVSNRTIKHNSLFLVDDTEGNILRNNDSGLGLYDGDTRFLSRYEIRLNNNTPPVCLLSSTEQGYQSTLVYTNTQMECETPEGVNSTVLEETIQLKRESLVNGALFEKFALTSYNIEAVKVCVSISFDADFRDIFEIRHLVPYLQRNLEEPRFEDNKLLFRYIDGEGVHYETHIFFKDFIPQFLNTTTIAFEAMLSPLETRGFSFEIQTHKYNSPKVEEKPKIESYHGALKNIDTCEAVWQEEVTSFTSDNDDFNEMISRSDKDIRMLVTESAKGKYVAAGIPWYTCLFGRDSIITARECLMYNPNLAKWTLNILAQYQGNAMRPERDEEPGKILHELRTGELAILGMVPHTPYYGSVDSTPLWLILLYEYFLWTRDYQTLCELWPHALAALNWIDARIEENPMGYVTYLTHAEKGVIHQGWKDSHNSAMYENGIQAEPPIALVEVQGYVYHAKRHMAILADLMGNKELKARLKQDCVDFKRRFNRDFWQDDLGYYALGLDSQGRPLRVISSNVGHCLESGIIPISQARQVASRLVAPDMFSGWGVRTLSSAMVAYNPMSYHNGTIWPHDNAMIARGLSEVGRHDLSEKIFSALYEAARLMHYKRLPELFCGFSRDMAKSDPPVRYPVACSPQAWAAASVFSMVQSMLNLSPELQNDSLKIVRPQLPPWMSYLQVKNMHIGKAVVDLEFRTAGKTVMVDVLSRHGKLDILVKK